jgi:hydrogenase maturation factor
VHAGFAIKKLDEESAMETIRLLREAAAFVDNLEAGKG